MFIVLYIKYRYCCQILMKLEFPQQIFKYILKYQIQWKFIQWEPSCSMRTDRQTDRQKDVTELIGFFFRNFSSASENSTFCPHSVFTCFVWISEQTAIISLYSINWLVCVTEILSVYCAVRTESVTPSVYGSFSPVTTYRALWKVISVECVISYCSGTRILSSNPNRDIKVCLNFLYILWR